MDNINAAVPKIAAIPISKKPTMNKKKNIIYVFEEAVYPCGNVERRS